MENLDLSSRMVQILQQNPAFESIEAIGHIVEVVASYRDQFKARRKEVGTVQMMKEIYELIDEEIAAEPEETKATYSCRKGCAHCCHILVDISAAEAEIIIDYCRHKNIYIDKQVLKEQKNSTEQTRPLMKNSACVFLDKDNTCKIYEVRPVACRKYFVTSHPDLCNYLTNGKGVVDTVANTQTEMMASGLINASKGGEIAFMLLQAIDNINKKQHGTVR